MLLQRMRLQGRCIDRQHGEESEEQNSLFRLMLAAYLAASALGIRALLWRIGQRPALIRRQACSGGYIAQQHWRVGAVQVWARLGQNYTKEQLYCQRNPWQLSW